MKTVYFFNDTSTYHAGSKSAVRSLKNELIDMNIIGINYVNEHYYDEDIFNNSDIIFVNGEGTMHHNSGGFKFLMSVLKKAQQLKKITMLVNSVYQDNSSEYNDVLKKLDVFSVRDLLSYEYVIHKCGLTPMLRLDSSADKNFINDGKILTTLSGIIKGDVHPHTQYKKMIDELDFGHFGLFNKSFEDVIATLKQVDVYITGQHHAIYAAGIANIPFIPISSNSHKIEGIIKWSGLPIPILNDIHELSNYLKFVDKNKNIYVEFHNFIMNNDVIRRKDLI